MTEPEKTKLASTSEELLEALQRLKDTERRKRHEEISSDSFHRLANEVDAISHEVFTLARDQRDIGERTSRDGDTIEDVDYDEQLGLALEGGPSHAKSDGRPEGERRRVERDRGDSRLQDSAGG